MKSSLKSELPGWWILLPVLGACLVAILAAHFVGYFAGLGAALLVGPLAAWAINRRLRMLAGAVAKVSGGDRYATIPEQPAGPLAELATAAMALQRAAIDADTRVVDQRRREAEARLHYAGRSFFTSQFRDTVDQVTRAFTAGSKEIGHTASDLAERNRYMHEQVQRASQDAATAGADVNALGVSAREILNNIRRSAGDIAESKAVSENAVVDITRADESVRSLAFAATRIGEVVDLIHTIARQTSLLALNASIEAVRSGEAGKGFAVVANDVKRLAKQTAQATDDISSQVRGIQDAVDQTASALQQVTSSVGRINDANTTLRHVLEEQTKELDEIAGHASGVAERIAGALPGIGAAVGHVDHAGEQVIGTARELIGHSEGLVSTVGRYFADLDSGAIKIGILHSLSGTMTASERPLQELLVMMIEQCNAAGGVLGRPVEAVITDPGSDPKRYAAQARELIEDDGVAAIFGCWTSASRKEVLPVVESRNNLLFYPSQYEGEEQSSNIFYTGATPQQQAIPAVDYLLAQGKKRFFLIGTDTVYPRTTNAILTHYLYSKGIKGDAIAEYYTPFDHRDWQDIVDWIKRFGAGGNTAIVSTVNGDANIYLFRELAAQGVTAAAIPAMTLSIGEAELPALADPSLAGHLAAWNYLNEIDAPENKRFVADWRQFSGTPNAVTDDPMEATWIGFHLWKAAVEKAGMTGTDAVRDALSGMAVRAPSGFDVVMDRENHHLHKPAFIGRITADARITPVWRSETLIDPMPWSPWLSLHEEERLRLAG
ncbi:transporter substrate-binding protein [Methyloligella sp. 2.7D]|nr:transporter substrate-binding protein [Methyloligella sp. GL2]QKP76271.1 transporter substrate-binding protein [Methyloligella sp. GL2]